MNRRKALAVAGAIAMTATTAAAAVGANLGLFGLSADAGDTGTFRPAAVTGPATTTPGDTAPTTAPEPEVIVETRVVDLPVPAGPATSPATPSSTVPGAGSPTSTTGVTTPSHTSTTFEDHGEDDDRDDDRSGHRDGEDDDHHEDD